MATVVPQVGQGHYHVDNFGRIFQQYCEILAQEYFGVCCFCLCTVIELIVVRR